MRWPVLLLAWVASPALAQVGTGEVVGTVKVTRGGTTVDASGVVVYLVGFEEPPPKQTVEIRQRGKRFIPDLVAITAGQNVSFPNEDTFLHNVFSPSGVRPFDLGQYPRGETKTKRFPGVGVIEVFCNIHPEMAATILVLPNRRFARVGADGRFRISGVPPGRWSLYAYGRRVAVPVRVQVEVTAGGVTETALALEETRNDSAHPNKFGEKYRHPEKYQ